jgi:osmoprotectant transport system permease protein
MVAALFAGAGDASAAGATSGAAAPLRIGSKRFTESYILAEIAVQTARASGQSGAVHVEGLGATAIAFKALEEGAIDLYPDYTGTIAETLFHGGAESAQDALEAALEARGLAMIGPLGFDNTYALAVRGNGAGADRPSVKTISDLARSTDLVVAVSHEFLGRGDGWPGLVARYALRPREVRAMDHGVAYAALVDGAVDVVDAYSTDAKIAKYELRLLEDDRHYFPSYAACFLYRRDARARFPDAFAALDRLRGTIDVGAMRAMNGEAELDGKSFADVAHSFLGRASPEPVAASPSLPRSSPAFLLRLVRSVVRYGPRHLMLVSVALAFATLVGVALGIVASRSRALGSAILGATGAIQTIPSLALLCLCIPLFGVGVLPALVALFVYGLLPITRNTCAALMEIPTPLRESAQALGLTRFETLRFVDLPLASRTVLAGIKTSAVLTVGTATVAAFIGAGGFGEPISVGLNLNDTPTMLEGAIPAALLALLVQALFVLVERIVVPRGLRVSTASRAE